MYLRKIFLVVTTLFFIIEIQAQTVYEHVSNKNIYEFIDELANLKIIEINSVIKPYSRKFIADKLVKAKTSVVELNKRQQNELDFYLNAFRAEIDSLPSYPYKINIFKKNKHLAIGLNPLGFFYKDKLFTFSVKPIWGINYFFNENGSIFHRWGGAEAYAYVGKHWGFYASLRDNNESKRISEPDFFTLRQGGAYKYTENGGGDYSEMRGGITYSWKWGSIGLIKDHLTWGNNYHGAMIMSDRAPSITQIKLHIKPVKWFELNYYHGWLVSMEVDTVRSYYLTNPPREVYRQKYIAANMLTFTPWKGLNISLGNSIVYSDMNVHPAYLIPVMFYKSIDHTINNGIDNQNSQMFLDISSRNLKKLHVYTTLYIDELKFDRINDPDQHNVWSYKVGAKTTNLLFQNLSLNLEYSMSMPLTYEHRVPTLTYESNYYYMGYYLQDNSQEIFTAITYKPIRGLHITGSYFIAQHGPDYPFDITEDIVGNPFMESVTWQNQEFSIAARWEFISNSYIFLEFIYSDITGDDEQIIKYTPEFFRGQQNTISAGFNLGF